MRQKRRSPAIPAGSMADVAFLLLIFFLVSTQLFDDRGISVVLPEWSDTEYTAPVADRNVLSIKVNAQDRVLIEGRPAVIADIQQHIVEFVRNPTQAPNAPRRPSDAIISLQNDLGTTYRAYVEVYAAIEAAYDVLRDGAAKQRFGQSFQALSEAEKAEIAHQIPKKISEAEPTDFAFIHE